MSDSIKKYFDLQEDDKWTTNTTVRDHLKSLQEKDSVVRKVSSEMRRRSAKGLI